MTPLAKDHKVILIAVLWVKVKVMNRQGIPRRRVVRSPAVLTFEFFFFFKEV